MLSKPLPAYSSGTADKPLLGQTLGANFERSVARFGDREALVDVATNRRWTYNELDVEIDEAALGLLELGIGKGDRVGIWALNCAEWVIIQYATAKIGAILVNVNPAYRAHELRYVIEQSGMRLLVSATVYRSSDYRAMVEQVRPDCPGLTEVVYIGEDSWDQLMARGSRADHQRLEAQAATLSFDDAINIQYTSGTTGFPKGATLSHHNILNNGYFVTARIGFTEKDRLAIPVPMYHCFGMVMGVIGSFSHGAAVIFPSPSFDPAATLSAVQAERATALYGVPTMFIAELGLPDFASYDLTTLRTGIMAGSPCPVEVMKRVVADMHMEQVAIAYGMTETSPVSTMTRMDDDLDRRTSTVGTVMPHVEVKIVDPATGLELPRGDHGELCTRGYSIMLSYWNEPERTAEAIDAAGWMHTGDLAVMDDQGYVNISGRIKDMVIRGGENIYPREIEEFLYTHPDIADVQVVGVPDVRYGEELMAWVVMKPDREPVTAEAIRAFCTGQLAHFKIPRYVHIVEGFPMTISGKVRKVEMREAAVGLLGLDDAARIRHA
ncbi:MAG: AMP-binding protein [Kineosporiaceae bacterium]|nr:AMP-binding protein [Kineosporiaceae bacterium]MBK8074976.1 AMP-binding protein [Kineosporiaceae bacterium]